jgi:hypothetical protein
MADNIDNLIIEHFKALPTELHDAKADIPADRRDIEVRLSSLEGHRASAQFDSARQSGRQDKPDRRIERIERRLGLAAESS